MLVSRSKQFWCSSQKNVHGFAGDIVLAAEFEDLLEIIFVDPVQGILLLNLHMVVYFQQQIIMENTQQVPNKSISNHPIKPISLQNNIKLIMATFLDTMAVEEKLRHLTNLNLSLSIPQAYNLIKMYEATFDRAYTQQMRFYIIATLWDQGLVRVGHASDWQSLIQVDQHLYRRQADDTWMGQVSKCNQERINTRIKQVRGQFDTPKSNSRKQQDQKLDWQLAIVIQQIQKQYHRQSLTMKYLFPSEGAAKHSDRLQQITRMFDGLDQNKLGSVEYSKIAKQLAMSPHAQTKTNLFSVYKLGNNLHIYDRSTNFVTNPNNKIDVQNPGRLLIKIENIMEVFNRIFMSQSMKDEQSSHTFQTISHILTQYEKMKEKTIADLYAQEARQLNQRNEQVGLIARFQHIRQAAYDIVHHGKNQNLMNLRGLGSLDLQNKEGEKTYRNTANHQSESMATFRNNTSKEKEEQEKNHKININSERNQSTAPNTKKQTALPNKQRLSYKSSQNTADQNTHFIRKNVLYQQSPEIHAFTATQEALESGRTHELEISTWSNAKYDDLLRQRIFQEIEMIRLEKIRNKIRYYDVLYLNS